MITISKTYQEHHAADMLWWLHQVKGAVISYNPETKEINYNFPPPATMQTIRPGDTVVIKVSEDFPAS